MQIKIGRPSTRDYIKIIKENALPNCPVTKADIKAAEYIFGQDIGALKGKTTRRRPPIVDSPVTPVPQSILEKYRRVTICVEVLHVNKIAMLASSVSRDIHFGTIEAMPSLNRNNMMESLKHICQIYRRGGFRVVASLMDGAFSYLRGNLADMSVALNDTSRDEHVGDIERYIRVIKERMRATYNTLPFKKMPGRLVIEMAKAAVFWLNGFPHARGVSRESSPRTIVTGQKLDYATKHCKFQFGEYCQTHEEHDNSMNPRTIGALALLPTGNAQGSFYVLRLSTGRVINRLHATPLPMPDDVIDRVHRMARSQKVNPGLMFGDRNNLAQVDDWPDDDDDDDDSDFDPRDGEEGQNDESEYGEDASLDAIEDEDNEHEEDIPNQVVPEEIVDKAEPIVDHQPEAPHDDDEGEEEDGSVDDGDNNADNDDDLVAEADGPNDGANEPGFIEEPTHGYSLRTRRDRNYDHRYRPDTFETGDDDGALLAEIANLEDTVETPQMSMKLRLKYFGELGMEAIKKEMQQLHDRKVMKTVHRSTLSYKQRRDALAYLMFLKRKRTGKIKGRGCADGRKQRDYIGKEESTSPTVKTEAVLLTAAVDAKERREVAVIDVPGAFMQADMDEIVHVRFTGEMVGILLAIDESYRAYVCYEKGEMILYVELLKALYGTLKAAWLFWEQLTSKLKEWGFIMNPYDDCVGNKIVDGEQLTVTWHVDDLKVSHVNPKAVDDFINQMQDEFGKEGPISISRGKKHDYLGMILDYETDGAMKIRMESYVKNMLNDMPNEMIGTAATPASNSLFKINEESPKLLNDEQKEIFVHLVMQALYLSQRGRPDIRTAVSFLCGRLTKPDEDDYKKLTRMMRYLQGTVNLPLTIRIDDSG